MKLEKELNVLQRLESKKFLEKNDTRGLTQMRITNDAKDLLENIFKQRGSEGIRLTVTAGASGPQIALSLEPPQEFDRIQTINGIKVAFDPAVTGTEELTLDKEESQDGVGLVLLGDGS